MVYFVQTSDGPIKIGTTTQLRIRSAALANDDFAKGREIAILGVIEGGRPVEKSLHERFKGHRIEREWFHPGPDLLDFIQAEAKPPEENEEYQCEPIVLLTYKADPSTFDAYKDWLDGLAEDIGVPVTVLLDVALKEIAERRKYKKQPKRLAR